MSTLPWTVSRSHGFEKKRRILSSLDLHLNAAFGRAFSTDEQLNIVNVTNSSRFSATIFINHTAHGSHMQIHQMVTLLRVYVSLTLHLAEPKRSTCDAHDESICRLLDWAVNYNRNGVAICIL